MSKINIKESKQITREKIKIFQKLVYVLIFPTHKNSRRRVLQGGSGGETNFFKHTAAS
jgi:hypothetical protein